jgi:sugar phosphate isomerase/epimerase
VNAARLDRGDYDIAPFLRALNEAGYRGPVSLQCYRVAGGPEENLRAARAKWLELAGALGCQSAAPG